MNIDEYQTLTSRTDLNEEQYAAVAEKFKVLANHESRLTQVVLKKLMDASDLGYKLDPFKRDYYYGKAQTYAITYDGRPCHVNLSTLTPEMAQLLHGIIGAITEIGELADAVLKHIDTGEPLDRVNVLEETGDVLWYLGRIAASQKALLSAVADANVKKLQTRFPNKFSGDAAVNRNVDTERKVLDTTLKETT